MSDTLSDLGESSPSGTLSSVESTQSEPLRDVPTINLLQELATRFSAGEDYPSEGLSEARSEEFLLVGKMVQDKLAELTNDITNRFSRKRLKHSYDSFIRAQQSHRPPLEDATWMELGCGSQNPAEFLFLLLMLGAKRCYGVDLDPIQDPKLAWNALADLAAAMFVDPSSIAPHHDVNRYELVRRIASFDLGKLKSGDESGVDTTRLIHLQEPAESLSLPDASVDVVISNSFLEHVRDLEKVIQETARITRQGGMAIHGIDGADHRRYWDSSIHSLAFLEADENEDHGCNLIRPVTMLEMFERHGFQVLEWNIWERIELTPEMIQKFAEPYRSMPQDTLEIVGGVLTLLRSE